MPRVQQPSLSPGLHQYFALLIVSLSSLCLLQCVSGLLLSMNYDASEQIYRDEKGRAVVEFTALRDKIDQDGDTVIYAGEVHRLPVDEQRLRPIVAAQNSSLFDWQSTPIAPRSYAWTSVYSKLNPHYRFQIRALHQWSSYFFVAMALVLIVSGLIFRIYRYSSEIRWLKMLSMFLALFFCAWLGSVLPWNLRSAISVSIVSAFCRDYIPFIGSSISDLIGSSVANVHLSRIFTLHALVLPVLLVYLLFGLRSRSYHEPRIYSIVRSLSYLIPSIMSMAFQVPASEIAAQPAAALAGSVATSATIRPEWYLQAPYYLMSHWPEDLASGTILCWIGLCILLPMIHQRFRSELVARILSIALAVGLVVMMVVGVIA